MNRYIKYLPFFVLAVLTFGASAQLADDCYDPNGDVAVHYDGESASVYVSEKGVTKNNEFFPFGDESVVKKSVYLNAHYIARARLKYSVLTRFAFKTGNQIVFIETTRQRKKAVEAYFDSLISSNLKNFSAPLAFNQNVLTFDKKGAIATGEYLHVEQAARPPEWPGEKLPILPQFSMDEIRDPKLFQRKELKETWDHVLRAELDYGYYYPDRLVRKNCNQR